MRKFITLGLCGVLAAGFTACKDDVTMNPGNEFNKSETEGAGYVSFTIQTDLSTRAFTDETTGQIFDKGDANEYALVSDKDAHLAIFFDENGTYYGSSNLEYVSNNGSSHADHTGGQEQVYTYVSKYNNSQALDAKYVVVLLNCDPTVGTRIKSNLENGMTLTQAMQYVVTTDNGNVGYYISGADKYFTMTSSTFFREETTVQDSQTINPRAETAANVVGTVYPSVEEAAKHPITVYVERMLAKHSVTFLDGDNKKALAADSHIFMVPDKNEPNKIMYVSSYADDPNNDQENLDTPGKSVYWQAYILNWDLNGLEQNSFLIKNVFRSNYANTTNAYPWDFSAATNWFAGNANGTLDGFFDKWNDYSYHRSYWAADQHYLAGGNYDFGLWGAGSDGTSAYYYPTQYRDFSFEQNANNKTDISSATGIDNTSSTPTSLRYISYNGMSPVAASKYSTENTYADATGLKGYGPLRYGTHVLVAAQLLIDGLDYEGTPSGSKYTKEGLYNGGNGEKAPDKYQAYGLYFNDGKYYVRYAYRQLAIKFADPLKDHSFDNGASFKAYNKTLYVKEGDNYEKVTVYNADQYFETAPAQVVHGDGKVVITPKAGKAFYYVTKEKDIDDTPTKYVALTEAQMKSIIYEFTEAAQHFNEGRMYYAVAVQHLFGKSNNTAAYKDVTKNGNYTLGQFGVVRNHWYTFNFKSISKIGIPVDDPDQPIIPDPEDEYYIAFDIVIIPWHVIDNGEIDIH